MTFNRISKRWTLLLLLVLPLCHLSSISAEELPYLNPKLPVEERVNDLMSRMSLTDKVVQMNQEGWSPERIEFYEEKIRKGLISSILSIRDYKYINSLQKVIKQRYGTVY